MSAHGLKRLATRFRGDVGAVDPVTPPHIAMVIGGLHAASGGAERVLVDVANGLHRRGYRVTVMTFQERNGPSFYPLDFGISRVDGRRRHSRRKKAAPAAALAGAARRRPIVGWAVWLVQYMPRVFGFRRLLRRATPDVAIAFMPSSFPYVVLAAMGLRTKTIASVHNVPERELGGDANRWDQNPADIWIRRRSLRWADRVTVLLDGFVDGIGSDIRDRVSVIPNMIPHYTGKPALVGNDVGSNRILAVGRLAHAKDHATLLRAWAMLENDFPDWSVEIFGRGPLKRDLQRLKAELGLQRLHLCAPTPAIYDEYRAAKFVAMPSIHEGFGLVTAEAMSVGLPVIGFSDCEGTNEIVVDGENGLLVDPGEDRAVALAAGMRRLIEDENFRISLARKAPASIARFASGPVLDRWEHAIGCALRGEQN